jgi:glyoxylase-like metal-dependent hydrolase (beta-lactamase superfamily II)
MKEIAIGPVRIRRVDELPAMPVDAGMMFANATPDLFRRGREWLDARFVHPERDEVRLAFHSFVVETGGRTILVDTCHGNHKTRRPPVDYAQNLEIDYLGNLARQGYRPEDIDLVFCTHLHFDHIGWNTRLQDGRWVPTFPNARYLMSRQDYAHFEQESRNPEAMDAEAFQDSILPVVAAGQAEFIDVGHVVEQELGRSVRIEGAPGHTPGSVVMHVETKAGAAIFSGDAMHHPLQIMEPRLYPHADWNPPQAARTRRALLERCADRDVFLLTAHFPDPTAGRVVSAPDGFRFAFAAD